MEPGTSELTAVMNRLEKVEKQNRRFKQIGALALVLLGSVFLMGQAAPQRTVEANEFVLRDTNGRMAGRFFVDLDGPGLVLFGANGKPRLGLSVVGNRGAGVLLSDADGRARIGVTFGSAGPTLGFYDTEGNARVSLSGEDEIKLLLSDREGFETVIGTTDLVTPRTGETHKTSAASVVLFDKDKKVLWKAP